MTPGTSCERKLIKTTRSVAAVLSSDFGIRSGFEVVDHSPTQFRPSSPRSAIVGSTPEANALRCFLGQQTHEDRGRHIRVHAVPNPSLSTVRVGDLVEARYVSSQRYLLVLSLSLRTICGAEVVLRTKTLLHDVAAENEVFLTQTKIAINPSIVTRRIEPNSVVLRYAWDERRPAFVGLNQWAAHSIDSEAEKLEVYHEGDFVLLPPQDDGPLLDIAQVHRIRKTDVYVRHLKRQPSRAAEFKHDRLLMPADELTRIERASFEPIALCQVSLLTASASSWYTDTTKFFVPEEKSGLLRPTCLQCTNAHRKERQQRHGTPPLTALELMCGAGGLSIGLDLSGACETKYALDADADSTKTFHAHHPTAKVYCGDAGDALQLAVSGQHSADGIVFPRRGEVDLIAAGPPCQGFSRKNPMASREAAERDPRNLLVCTVLGWVDHLRPKYLILENVEGFTSAKLGGHDQGMVKLVMSSLLQLGYGVTCGYVQAGAFGSPQSRKRFVLMAAREGLTLPRLPRPSHDFLGQAGVRYYWSDGDGQSHATEGSCRPTAVLPGITVMDAISDLPMFDWKDPHLIYAGPDTIELEREEQGIPQLEVVKGEPTGFAHVAYRSGPQNSYQERMRVLEGQMTRCVTQHQTSDYGGHVVERVVNVELEPGANYDSWSQPSVNKPALLNRSQAHTDHWNDEHFKFERLDGDRYFKTLMTTVPAQGSMLHPTQRRLLSVRECARAQGFPDWVDFHTDTNMRSAYRQIGNAVPIPLANALGKSLIAARMTDSRLAEELKASRIVSIIID
ncbi:related to Cytosine-specific methyltransferase [Ustilago trichophora]|uniref:Cytosine-specific methyltransferase n=1 Tax=Ustilago trichophora TaxID=86804 RepID=A0A5C3ENJ0_9BASI|nr:related to Cytosine-specific methyltransferase [Ustilago trichophora]